MKRERPSTATLSIQLSAAISLTRIISNTPRSNLHFKDRIFYIKDRSFTSESEMGYRFKDPIEIYSSVQDEPGSYYPGILLAAIGRSQYLVQYKTRLNESGKPLVRVVDENEVRPEPPDVGKYRVLESDVVDAYVNGGWKIGRIVKKVEPNYYVKVDFDGSVFHLAWFRVRLHLDLVEGRWVFRKIADHGLQNHVDQVKPIQVVAPEAENDPIENPVKLAGKERS
ncbi:unnamed protein product [Rhodiola kirilowii]